MVFSETDLIVPTLALLLQKKERGLTTSELIKILEQELDISEADKKILAGRNDSRFSQKVRNLVSHRTLVSKGLATYKRIKGDGLHKITDIGEKYVIQNVDNFDFIIQSPFTEEQRKSIVENDFSNLVIEEGFIRLAEIKTRKRSKELVEIAKKHYAKNKKIFCSGCNFNFDNFYGDPGKGYIEIHHLKPIFSYGKNIRKSLTEALKNVRPLCSNCHRLVHRKKQRILSIVELQKLVKSNGQFTIGVNGAS